MKRIFIVIPVYNEAKVIGDVVEGVKKNGYKNIIIVDDGSEDDTYIRAKKKGVCVVKHIINRGKGAAVKTGIEAAKILGADIVVTLDGDGQHNPKDIGKMVKALGNHDVVLGSRRIDTCTMPVFKVVANHLGNFFTWMIYGLWVSDSQSGFRAYSKKAFSLLDTKHDRYEYESEVIREIVNNKLKSIEVPVEVRYSDYSMNKPQKQTFVNGLKTLIRLIVTS